MKEEQIDTNLISDGYHTFGELYEHRIVLYMALCAMIADSEYVWRTKVHSDDSVWDGWFILGIGSKHGEQITYHLPDSKWDGCNFASPINKAPEWDGHTANDVLERIKTMFL